MSYSAIFKPTAEVMEKYKNECKGWMDLADNRKKELLITILQDNSKQSISDALWMIQSSLKGIAYQIRMQEYKNMCWQYDKEGVVTFRGNQFSYSEPNWTEEEAISHFEEKLLILSKVVVTPDYFEEDGKFYKKWNEINADIECFEEAIIEATIYSIMEDLKDYQEK